MKESIDNKVIESETKGKWFSICFIHNIIVLAKDFVKDNLKVPKVFPEESDVEVDKETNKADISNNKVQEEASPDNKQETKSKIMLRKRSSVCLGTIENEKQEKIIPSLELERYSSLQNVPTAPLNQPDERKTPEDVKIRQKQEQSPPQQGQQSSM